MKKLPLLVLLVSSSFLVGCVPLGIATGAGAAAGIASAKEGGIRSAVTDTAIRARINDYWFKYNTEMFQKLDMTVDQGRVLLTGVVQKPEHRVEAVRLAWQAKGVKQVINEIQVGNARSLGSYANDEWISSTLKAQMVFSKDIQSINYTIDTVRGVVYLMGVAQSPKELDHVIRLARKTKGVKQVVSYVKMVGEPITSIANGSISSPSDTAPVASPQSTLYQQPTPVFQGTDSSPSTPAPSLTPSKSDIQSEVLPP